MNTTVQAPPATLSVTMCASRPGLTANHLPCCAMRTTITWLGRALTAGCAFALLTACAVGTEREGAASSSTESPSVLLVRDRSYDDVTQLRDALVAAGFECPSWRATSVIGASSAGDCSESLSISVYGDPANLAENLATLGKWVDPQTLLVGPNWLVNSSEAVSMQAYLGGEMNSPARQPEATTAVEVAPSPITEFGEWTSPVDGISVQLGAPVRRPTSDLCKGPSMKLKIKNSGASPAELSWITVEGGDGSRIMSVEGGPDDGYFEDATIDPGSTQVWDVLSCEDPSEKVTVRIQIVHDNAAVYQFSE